MKKPFLKQDASEWIEGHHLEKLGHCDDPTDVDESVESHHCRVPRETFNCIHYDEAMVKGYSKEHEANLKLYNEVCPLNARVVQPHYRKTEASNGWAKCTPAERVTDAAECKKAYQIVFGNDMNDSCDPVQDGCQVMKVHKTNAPTGCIFDYHNGKYRAQLNGLETSVEPGDTSQSHYGSLCRKD